MSEFTGLNGYPQLLVREFLYFSTIRTNQMMMRIVSKCLFVLRKLSTKLMFDNQFAFLQKFKRIVDGCQTHPVIFLHNIEQDVGIKVPFVRIDMFQNSISFGCFPVMMLF